MIKPTQRIQREPKSKSKSKIEDHSRWTRERSDEYHARKIGTPKPGLGHGSKDEDAAGSDLGAPSHGHNLTKKSYNHPFGDDGQKPRKTKPKRSMHSTRPGLTAQRGLGG